MKSKVKPYLLIFGVLKMSINVNIMESEYYSSLTDKDKHQYCEKLRLTSGERLPDPYLLTNWNNEISNLPDITWRDVTSYLIDTPSNLVSVKKESVKAYKSLQAYDFFVCGHVQDVHYHNISEESLFCFIKTEVDFFYIFLALDVS